MHDGETWEFLARLVKQKHTGVGGGVWLGGKFLAAVMGDATTIFRFYSVKI